MAKSPQLPPPGPESKTSTGKSSIVNYINGLVLEDYQRQAPFNIWNAAERNNNLYLYDRSKDRPTGKYRAFKIQNTVNLNTAIESASRPSFAIKQRVTGEPKVWYFNVNAAPPDLAAQLPPETYQKGVTSDGKDLPPRPLTMQEVQFLQALIQESRSASATGGVATVPPQVLVAADDSMIREALEMVLDAKYDEADGEFFTIENIRKKRICGQSHLLTEFDPENMCFKFRNLDIVCVHQDSFKTDIAQAAFAVVDEFLGRDEAISIYPDLRDAINENAQAGAPTLPGTLPYILPYYWLQRYFYREIIIIRTAFIRNQPYPLTVEEAQAQGKVGVWGVPDTAQQLPQVAPDPNAVPGVAVPPVVAPPMVPKMFLRTDGNAKPQDNNAVPDWDTGPVDMTHPKWPTKQALRQIQVIAGAVVYDEKCGRSNIPLGHNVNIPIDGTPWGQGDPERLERLEEAYNKNLTDNIVTGEFNTYPAKFAPMSVLKQNQTLLAGGYTVPNKIYGVEDATWMQFQGKVISSELPPPANTDTWKREEMLGRAIDDAGGRQDAARGKLPSANASGVMVKALQDGAVAPVNLEATRTERMLGYIAQVMIGDILTFYTADQLADEFRKFPVYIWEELKRRWDKHYLFCGVKVTLKSGSGVGQDNEVANMIQARQVLGLPSVPTIMEAMGKDGEEEADKEADFERRRQFAAQNVPGMELAGGEKATNPNLQRPPQQPAAAQQPVLTP